MKTPGVVIPSLYSSMEECVKDVKRRDEEAGYTPFNFDEFSHSDAAEEFLDHHGVKGMRWGVRKDRRSGVIREPLKSKSDRKKARRGAAKAVGTAVVGSLLVAAGAVYVGNILGDMLYNHMHSKVSTINHGHNFANTAFKDIPYSSIKAGTHFPGGEDAFAKGMADIRRHLNDPNYVWKL